MGTSLPSPSPLPCEEVRVVSLLPSLTEIVAQLGKGEQLVGITHECDFPPDVVMGKKVVTESFVDPKASQREINDRVVESLAQNNSLYALREGAFRDARPTHVLTQSLCDVCAVNFEQVKSKCSRLLADDPYKLLSVEPQTLRDVRDSIQVVGASLDCSRAAIDEALARFDEGRASVRERVHRRLDRRRPKVALLEWFDPLFTGGHWIHEMVEDAGGSYGLTRPGERSAVMTRSDLAAYDPDVIVLAPCGFDLDRCERDAKKILYDPEGEHFEWWSGLRAVRESEVYACDGNQYFSRPSPRLVEGIEILAEVLHGVATTPRGEEGARWRRLELPPR
ncbi:Fe/B12 periplasmic-binding domain-containing protein [Chloropicon primus]|uniref:Fe/B12 periplasmic-binding domain-containing protein n=1 Tax=Chloropicon primus TaxID=1764295 RepID=A0A7S2T5Q4_9CHLO|nr:Fe/B12 periplasmic-binding domain-containing protein [Chloropicon primus]